MEDEKDPNVTDETKEVNQELKGPDIKALAEQLEQIKRAQAGSDKAYQEAAKRLKELESENENLKKEKMSEKERAEFELKKKEAELEQRAREVKDATLRLSKVKAMADKGVDPGFYDFLPGETEEEVVKNLDRFIALIKKQVGSDVNKVLTGIEKPKSGDGGGGKNPHDDIKNLSFAEIERRIREGS